MDPMTFNGGLGMESSYYVATAPPLDPFPALKGDHTADLVVIGAGATGLSAALHAAQAGLSVIVLEGGKVGWGASGRNGGQLIPGLRKGAAGLVASFGRERGKALFDLALEARGLVLDLVARHGIDCELKTTGHLGAAVKASDMRWMEAEAECLAGVMTYPHTRLVTAAEAREIVDSPCHGGLFDTHAGHFHPLKYAYGLARAAAAAGATIFEGSPAIALETGAGVRVKTPAGVVTATHAILAGDALLAGLCGRVESRIMPVASYVVTTAPLLDPRALIPGDAAISDSRFVVNYYRTTADGRVLFGGGEKYTPTPPRDIAAFVRPHLEAVFPSLAGVEISHAWGGLVSVTTSRLPHVGREGPVLFAHGYSGMGALLSTFAGKLLVEEVEGRSERFDLFAGIEPAPFPGGGALRGPLHVLGMLWYAMRDRLP
jgi:gamma-glutamylputrescine oxidase